jgi:hypothetical protein
MSWDEIGKLTIEQLKVELRIDHGRPVSETEITMRVHERRDEVFATICRRYQIRPSELDRLDVAELAALVRKELGDSTKIDPNTLVAHAREYARRSLC